MFQQTLADHSWPESATTLPLQRGHRLSVFCSPAHQAKERQLRVDVEREAEIRDPVVHGHANASNRATVHPHAGAIPPGLTSNVKFFEQTLNNFSEPVHIRLQSQTKPVERQNR